MILIRINTNSICLLRDFFRCQAYNNFSFNANDAFVKKRKRNVILYIQDLCIGENLLKQFLDDKVESKYEAFNFY